MEKETVLSGKERRIIKAFQKKSRNGENRAVEVKVYRTDAKNASSIFELLPEDGPLEIETVLNELNEFIEDEYENYERIVVKVKRNSKDAGEPIIIPGGKKRAGFSKHNNNNSGFNLTGSTGLGIVMQLMEKNNQSATQFQQFKTEILVDKLKDKNKEDKKYFKKLIKKVQKKKKKKKKKPSVFEKVMNSEVVQEIGKGLASKVLGEPLPSNVIPMQQPYEYTKVAGMPSNQKPKENREPHKKAPEAQENYEEIEEAEIYEMSEDQQKALEGLQLLENYELADAGDLLFTACHFLTENLGTPTGDFLMKQLLAHKEKALVDLT